LKCSEKWQRFTKQKYKVICTMTTKSRYRVPKNDP